MREPTVTGRLRAKIIETTANSVQTGFERGERIVGERDWPPVAYPRGLDGELPERLPASHQRVWPPSEEHES